MKERISNMPRFFKEIFLLIIIVLIAFTIMISISINELLESVEFKSLLSSKFDFVSSYKSIMGFNIAESELTIEDIIEELVVKEKKEELAQIEIERKEGKLGVVHRAIEIVKSIPDKIKSFTSSEFKSVYKSTYGTSMKTETDFGKSRNGKKPRFIVIHYAAGKLSNTLDSMYTTFSTVEGRKLGIDYIIGDKGAWNSNTKVSTHYTTHSGGYGDKEAKAVGGGLWKHNEIWIESDLIGIEVNSSYTGDGYPEINSKRWKYSDDTIANAIVQVKKLMAEYNIPPENVLRHFDTAGKSCPSVYGWTAATGSEQAWIDFKLAISDGKYKYAGTPQKEFEQWKKLKLQKGEQIYINK